MNLDRPIGASNEIDRVSKSNNSLSIGAKQNALRQTFFAFYDFLQIYLRKIQIEFFLKFFMI